MARPRIFVSSTYFDMKHIRASLDIFIESIGYDSVLSEKGDIAYSHERPLDQSCYREAESADIFVLIVGGRYGSEASGSSKKTSAGFFDRYESITKKEFESASNRDIPIYVLIEKGVYSEYQTFLRNKGKTDINYAHVDSVNVFLLIEDILSRPRNNPVQTFEKFEDIEVWLREQWAGLFRELLRRQSQQQQLLGLTAQVSELKEVNETLKKYLEAVMTGVGKEASSKLIHEEQQRLEEIRRQERLRANQWARFVMKNYDVDFDSFVNAISSASSFEEFARLIQDNTKSANAFDRILELLQTNKSARFDFNEARVLLSKAPIKHQNTDEPTQRPGVTTEAKKHPPAAGK